jgi:hypothetical protein
MASERVISPRTSNNQVSLDREQGFESCCLSQSVVALTAVSEVPRQTAEKTLRWLCKEELTVNADLLLGRAAAHHYRPV